MGKDKATHCPVCGRRALEKTIEKYGGKCYHCSKPKQKRRTLDIQKLDPIRAKDIDETFDLWEAKAEYEEKKLYLNQNPKLSLKLFAKWFMANRKTRSPQTMREVARCLDCTIAQLDKWLCSKEFRKIYDEMSFEDAYYQFSAQILRTTAEEAAKGNKDCLKLWYNLTGGLKKPEEKEKFGEVSSKLKKKRDKLLKINEKPLKGVSVKKKEHDIAEKIRELDEE